MLLNGRTLPCSRAVIELLFAFYRFSLHVQHKGHAFVAFTSSSAVSAAAEAVKLIPEWGCQATVGPARKLPPRWTPEITSQLQVEQ